MVVDFPWKFESIWIQVENHSKINSAWHHSILSSKSIWMRNIISNMFSLLTLRLEFYLLQKTTWIPNFPYSLHNGDYIHGCNQELSYVLNVTILVVSFHFKSWTCFISMLLQGLNVYSILLHDTLVMSRDAVNKIVERMHTPINRWFRIRIFIYFRRNRKFCHFG